MEETSSFIGNFLHQKRLIILKNILKKLDHNYKVLDMGCGGGVTMTTFKESGFTHITGIDFAEESIVRCEKKGYVCEKDVFLMDATHTSFPSNSFDIVFSEGLWEHFPDPRPHMAEAARLSKQYIIVYQPDHFSFFGFLMYIGWGAFNKNKGGVKEYSFLLSYFKQFLKFYGFDFIKSYSTPFHEGEIMVFKKHNTWHIAQQHELTYSQTKEPRLYHAHSLEFWQKLLSLENIEGQGIEVGCGNIGMYNFTSNIIGLDTINFHKHNFIQASAEHLPIIHSDFAILCNSLDHCENPDQVLKEITLTTNKLILRTYIHPKIVSFLLSKLDKMHPYHFTKSDIKHFSLMLGIENFIEISSTITSPFVLWHHTDNWQEKFKLLIMYLLNIHAICIHLSISSDSFKQQDVTN